MSFHVDNIGWRTRSSAAIALGTHRRDGNDERSLANTGPKAGFDEYLLELQVQGVSAAACANQASDGSLRSRLPRGSALRTIARTRHAMLGNDRLYAIPRRWKRLPATRLRRSHARRSAIWNGLGGLRADKWIN
eukprot:1073604-Rhodomonas_salina.2